MVRSRLAQLVAPALILLWTPPARAEDPARELALDEALRLLDAQSLTLAQARARAEEARAIVRQATAPLLPTLVAGGNYTRNNTDAQISIRQVFGGLQTSLNQVLPTPIQLPTSGLPGDVVIQPREAWNASATLRVPLVVPDAWYGLAAARQGEASAREQLQASRLQLRLGFLQAAWASSAADEVVEASERALASAREHAESAQRAVRAGTGAALGALQARTEQVRRESDLAATRAERARAHLALGVLLGRAEPVRVELPPAAPPASFDLPALTSEGLDRRPEVRAQQAQLASAQRQIDAANWRLAPQLSASLGAVASTVAFPTGDKTGWKATVDLTWSLYDGGARYGRRDQTRAQAAAAAAALEVQRVEVARQVQDAARDIDVARERLRLAEQQKGFASEAAGSARRSFAAGLATSLDVLDANLSVYQADVAIADARARLGASVAALESAVGRP